MEYNKEQLDIIESNEPYLQVIAAAGSGKTRTMTGLVEKILKDGRENESEILVITFTRKAAEEIKNRIEENIPATRIKIQTFHSYCYRTLLKYHPVYSASGITMIDKTEKEKFVRKILIKQRFLIGGIPYKFFLDDSSGFTSRLFPDLFKQIQKEYKEYKKQKNLLDFDDLQLIYLNDLKTGEYWAVAAADEIKRIIIDEFQDTDPLQLEWLKYMNPAKLTVVGDDWQAIYGFRGASPKPFIEFENFFPCKKYFLSTNYRSLPGIIKVSSIPVGKNKFNIKKKVKPFRKGKAVIKKVSLNTENIKSYYFHINEIIKQGIDVKILCRSNFRIREYAMYDIPEANLMTIHAAKGLEFKNVVVDLVSGWNTLLTAPLETIEEERRILYVALSRAEDRLLIVGNDKKKKKRIEDEFFGYFNSIANLQTDKLQRIFN